MAGFFAFLGPAQSLFAFLGSVVLVIFLLVTCYFTLKNVFVFFLAEPLGMTIPFKDYGEWAVVTGATDGIGKGYAFDLARRGCNIVLISRTLEKLKNVAQEIETIYNVRTKVIAVDFTADESIYDTVREQLTGLEIGTLINNVGMGHPYPEMLHKVPGGEDFLLQMIRCNCVAQTLMTRIVLPQMVARKKGVVVNLSSGAGAQPYPFLACYSATKAFNDFLGMACEQEYRDTGVIFQVIQPFMVATNLSGTRKTNLFVLDAKPYARSCLNTVGWFSRTNGHPSHAIQNWIVSHIPAIIGGPLTKAAITRFRDASVAKLKRKGQYKGV